MLILSIRTFSGGPWIARRLFNLVYFGEDPHILALTLLPIALLFLRRGIARRDPKSFTGAVISCSAVVLTNAFGAPVLALGALCIVLRIAARDCDRYRDGSGRPGCWSSPWLPPSLIETIRSNAWTARGQYDSGLRAYVAVGVLLLAVAVLWAGTRWLVSSFERFVWLFALAMCARFRLRSFGRGSLWFRSHIVINWNWKWGCACWRGC